MLEPAQHQHLDEGVVLERDAFLHPLLADPQQVGEVPGLQVLILVPEVFLQRHSCQIEGDLVGSQALEIVELVHVGFADDR